LDRGRQVCLNTERHLSANNCCKVVQIGVSRFRSKSANYLIHTHTHFFRDQQVGHHQGI
jgi:hypothetical protein